jgi:hypothetical protein
MKGRVDGFSISGRSKGRRTVGGSVGRKPRLNENGSAVPSKRKYSNVSPSHRMPYTGTRKPSFVLCQSHAMVSRDD